MRIAHLGSKGIPSKGGTERVVEAVAVRHAPHHLVTVYGNAAVCESGFHLGVRVLSYKAPVMKHAGPVLLQIRCALHALTRDRYDVVHVHGSEHGFIVPLLRVRYPVVSTNHGPAYLREKWSSVAKRMIRANERLSVVGASAATAVAPNQALSLGERYGRTVVPVANGVDLDQDVDVDGAAQMLKAQGIEPGSYVLFAAARVDPTKGCHTLLEALPSLTERVPVVVVGDLGHARGYEKRLRDLARGLPVSFLPRLDDKALLLGLLALCRVFVFPSTVEAMSMMLLEALAVGVVSLASDIPENVSVVPPTFPLFSAGNPDSLARGLETLLRADLDQRRALSSLGREWVRSRHDWDRIARQYMAIYQEIVKSRE